MSMPCATTSDWQFVAIGIKFREIGITSTAGPVHYLLWRQRRAELLPAYRLAPRGPDDLTPEIARPLEVVLIIRKLFSRTGVVVLAVSVAIATAIPAQAA